MVILSVYRFIRTQPYNQITHQVVKDVSLMHVNGDECFKLRSFNFCEFFCSLFDQHIQQFQERCVGLLHHLLVILSVCQRLCRVSGPYHLDS